MHKKKISLILASLPALYGAAGGSLAAPTSTSTPQGTEETRLGEVRVEDSSTPYRVGRVEWGPFGERAVSEIPFSLQTVTAEEAENLQMKSVRDAFRLLPSVQGENIRPQTRGLQAGVVQNTRMDGLNISATTDYPMEQFERVEVQNGLAGALYGPANPAGTFNYVLKRPTDTPLYRATLGYTSASGILGKADLSDRLGPTGQIGYRVNVVDENGEGYVTDSRLQRKLLSLALDLRLSPDTVLETNASRYHYLRKGFPGTFALASGVSFPSAPDPSRSGYGQVFGGDNNVTETYSLRLRQQLNDDWKLVAGVQQQVVDRESTVPTNTLTNNSGAYTTTAATTTYTRDAILANTLSLQGKVMTGSVRHDLVLGNTGFRWERYTPYNTGSFTLGSASLSQPQAFREPSWYDFRYRYRSVDSRQQSLILGDTLGLDEHWSVLLATSYSWISVDNYNKTGKITSSYDDQGWSPTGSIIYKLRPDSSVYVSYADSLQQGDAAPTGTANAGENLPAYRSKQWEAGTKLGFTGWSLGLALFRIQRPFAFTDSADNRYKTQGDQVNRGLETSVSSRLGAFDLTGALTWLDPRVNNTGSASTSDKQVLGLPRVAANLLVEYRVPGLAGLVLTANLNHQGRRPGNNANSTWVDGYTVADLGARYTTRLAGKPTTWRLAVNNVTDKAYWANITPSGQNGYTGTGNGTGTLGAPRTVQASVQVDF